ncbi:MAG: dTMP kinase [Chloroflexota bacterium]|nr:MAG: dTMP kinase [Chloroflexota bacterium]
MSLFITFEGSEGCGKSTQARALWRKLSRLSIPAVLTHEPGGTALGNQLRHVLKRGRQDKISPIAELFLFAACRIQLVTEVIRPNLEQGKVVICDRFADSTTAYQGYGRGLDLETVKKINDLATQGTTPHLIIFLDIPTQTGLSRKKSTANDRFEAEDIAFHNKVRAGYLKLAAEEPERWLVIDANLPRARIGKIIWDRVKQLLQTEKASRHE